MLTTQGLCYLSADEPGIGGRIKCRPEDFVVEEIPLFEPDGEGDHLLLLIEKRRRLTTDVVRELSRHFSVPRRDVGFAGLKDKHAITQQWFSVEHVSEDRAMQFEHPCMRMLDIVRHRKKLKRGNLKGNRFSIKIRDVNIADAPRAKRILDHLARSGVPNFLGEQRFGYKENNHLLGRCLILGQLQAFFDLMLGRPEPGEPQANYLARQAYDAGDYREALDLWPKVHRFERQAIGPLSRGAGIEHALNAIDRTHLTLLVSAFQSAVFNRILNDRIQAGRFDQLLAGDLAFIHQSRGIFTVVDPQAEQSRCDRLEISPTGPMWGKKMTQASGETGIIERQALQAGGVEEGDLEHGRFSPSGARRSLRMLIEDPQLSAGSDEYGPFIHCEFELGRGSFATIVLREMMKNDVDHPIDPPVMSGLGDQMNDVHP